MREVSISIHCARCARRSLARDGAPVVGVLIQQAPDGDWQVAPIKRWHRWRRSGDECQVRGLASRGPVELTCPCCRRSVGSYRAQTLARRLSTLRYPWLSLYVPDLPGNWRQQVDEAERARDEERRALLVRLGAEQKAAPPTHDGRDYYVSRKPQSP